MGLVYSYFKPEANLLSIKEIEDILLNDENPKDKTGEDISEQTGIEYNFSTKIGTITGEKGGNFVVDGLHEFSPEDVQYEVGQSVSYQIVSEEGHLHIYNVFPVDSDWNAPVERNSILSSRVLLCKMEKRDKRFIFLSPGEIKVDLDKVSLEFIPYVGDFLEVDVKYEVDEQTLDLSGRVVEVQKIRPLRPHIINGKITFWNGESFYGIINGKIFFDINSLSCGYVPIMGDSVVAEIIESHQPPCSWRALKIIPETVHKKVTSLKQSSDKLEENHPGLNIDSCELQFSQLGETKTFSVTLTNTSQETFKFLRVESADASQIEVAHVYEREIGPGMKADVDLQCTARNMGSCNEFLLFCFEGFKVGRYVNIVVNPGRIGGSYRKNVMNYDNSYQGSKTVVRGQKNYHSRFRADKTPHYQVPKRLLDLVIQYEQNNDIAGLMDQLKIVKKCLFDNLNALNYEDKFHTLLHLDEIHNIICIRQYDQERACFITNKGHLMLEIDNLSERRPGIVLGDRIMACDPQNPNQEFEGNVSKVGAKHVYLQFSVMFHETHDGKDFSIRIVAGRAAYKRQHHAIYLVSRHLGREWLFPTKISEKPSQVSFIYAPYDRDVNTNAQKALGHGQMVLRKSVELKKIKHLRDNNFLLDQDGNLVDGDSQGFKLEWYNQDLNCKQKDAVINVLKGVCRPLPYIIFGPPGTGKTVTVIEAILQILRLIPESRILVTAPSNSATDLLALRLVDSMVLKPGDLVRLVSVNHANSPNIPAKLVPFCATASVAKEGTTDDNIMRNGLKFDCSRSMLGRHKITVSTCSTAGTMHQMKFDRGHFSHIFVDEAGQGSEPEIMIPVSLLDKNSGQVVLAGDPMQLGPVVLSYVSKHCGLEESYLERIISRVPYARDIQGFPDSEGYDPRFVTKLLHNYRSLSVLLNLFSKLFYHGELIATLSNVSSPEMQLLESLSSVLPKRSDGRVSSIVFHGVEGQNYQSEDSPSWFNPHEASQIFFYINEFFRLGVKAASIAVITPYVKQVRELRHILEEAEFDIPRIGTVEEFQGQEFDIVLMSTVRSSQDYVQGDVQHSLGFVSVPRRLNVAISRAKSLLVIVGNPKLLCHDTYWRNVIAYAMEYGAYRGCDLE